MNALLRRMAASAGARFCFAISAVALVVLAWLVRPVRVDTVGYDAAASVLYFERLVHGQRLEAFVGTTPKPFFTVLYGLVHAAVGDWRVISWLGLAACAAGIGLAATLARRIGGLAAGVFVAVGLLGSAQLIRDAALAYGISWALVGWAGAGLAATARRPRWAVAGVLLLLANLVRFEALVVSAVAIAMIALALVPATGRRARWADLRPILAWVGLGPLLALPIQALHDLALTGNPLYSQVVPVQGSVGLPLLGFAGSLRYLGQHFLAIDALVVLALLGAVLLVHRRHWALATGLLALGPGVAAFIVLLAVRKIYVSDRYIAAADLAVIFAAGIGFSALRVPALEGVTRAFGRIERWRPAGIAAVAIVVAAMVVTPFAPLDRGVRATLSDSVTVHVNLERNLPFLAREVGTVAGIRDPRPGGSPTAPAGSRGTLLVPVLLVPEVAVDLGLPLDAIAGLTAGILDPGATTLVPGEIVYHDRRRDTPAAAFTPLEIESTTSFQVVQLVPVRPDRANGTWLLRVAAR